MKDCKLYRIHNVYPFPEENSADTCASGASRSTNLGLPPFIAAAYYCISLQLPSTA